MKKIIIIFGNITFDESTDKKLVANELKLFKTNNQRKALVHSIDKVFEVEDNDKAIDALIYEEETEAWLIPSQYNGEVIYEVEPNKDIVEVAKTFIK